MQTVHPLPPHVANQIAAGEVVERPASVVKELVENSLDAGATTIRVRIEKAGKKRIEVEDNGCGLSNADASMAMQRHATSKISSAEELHTIASHGFRGEALPSIASVCRFRMVTCLQGAAEGCEVRVNAGAEVEIRPAASRDGTRIEALDLFLNTPARLRFMRTDKTEEAVIIENLRAIALGNAHVAFSLELDGRMRMKLPSQQTLQARIAAIMGLEFVENSIEQYLEHEGIQISGRVSLPTWHHRDSSRMLFLVNGRVIRDKLLIAALRAGYRDVMFHDRYPVALLQIEIDPKDVDINVHPAKRELRFRAPQVVRAAVVAMVRTAIEKMGKTVSSQPANEALARLTPNVTPTSPVTRLPAAFSAPSTKQRAVTGHYDAPSVMRSLFSAPEVAEAEVGFPTMPDLGEPLAQIHQRYILAQSSSGIVLIDQHAAHERITYEALKAQLNKGELPSQMLLTPATMAITLEVSAWLFHHVDDLALFGFGLLLQGEEQLLIQAVPAMLSDESPTLLVSELIEACMLMGIEAEGNSRILERWLGNRACKGSIKSGRNLNHDEQKALLREMKATDNIAQCNHGRPTYVCLSLNDLDRLFGRKE
ncbi:MAG: DNA mismatch repair endonuclease MutL [Mariprofundaceae bacterium]